MRFFLGLLCGAVATVGAASLLQPLLLDAPAATPVVSELVSVDVPLAAVSVQEPSPLAAQEARVVADYPDAAASLPATQETPSQESEVPTAERPAPDAGNAAPLAALPAAAVAAMNAAPTAADAAAESQDAPSRIAVVWKPFHSRVSADGFARRLSTQLGTPFRTVKQGAAKYYVVFDYVEDAERELLRGQVASLTGFAAP